MDARPAEQRVLHEIISTVASSLEPSDVLRAVVRLLSDASAVHACFVYLLDETGSRLVLEAASEPYDHLVGEVALERGEGLAWWAADRREPAFIRENALADPRNKYVPELEEERFQSLLAVPVHGRGGDLIGVITAHTEAPREFTHAEVDFLVSSASLVAGAIENARLYDEMRTRVLELEQLTGLAEAIAEAASLDELLPVVALRARELLQATASHLYLLDAGADELAWSTSYPPDVEPRRLVVGLAELGPELARGGRATRVAVPLVAGDELLGLLVAERTARVGLARAVASQAAVGIKKVQLIARLTEENLIKDFFEDLAAGRIMGDLEGRATRLGCDLDRLHAVLMAEPADDGFERSLQALVPGSLCDRRERSLRAIVRVPAGGFDRLVELVRNLHRDLGGQLTIGISSAGSGAASFAEGFDQARQAMLGSTVLKGEPTVVCYEDLGAYKYLLRLALEGGVRDATVDAVSKLTEYDAQRGSSLLSTLEEFLRRRGSISSTSEALFVHPNTLRQRLRRIGELSGLDLRTDDWLMIEIAVKLVKLRGVFGSATPHTPTL
jgi:GAF domain-containing protein